MKRKGFYVELPPRTIATIRRMAKNTGQPQWQVVDAWVPREPGKVIGIAGGPRRKARGKRV